MNAVKNARVAIVLLLLLAGAAAPCWGKTFYSIQVAASTDKAAAEETLEQMNRMGHHAFIRLETVPGKGQWHRVYIERFGSKAQADKEAAMLRSLGLVNECYVRALKNEPDPQPQPDRSPSRQVNAGSGTLHFLHVASYQEKENAEKEVARLARRGEKAFFVEETVAGKRWFRTYLGEFADLKEARRAGAQLKEKGVIGFDKGGTLAATKTKK